LNVGAAKSCGSAEIRDLQRAGIPTKSAEELLARMQTKVDELCAERDRLVGESRRKYKGKDKYILGPQIRIRTRSS
jgi:hypothetical protein